MKKLLISTLIAAGLLLSFPLLPITYTFSITGPMESGNKTMALTVAVVDALVDDNDTIVLNINSPGGSVVAAMRLYNSLLESGAKIVTHNKAVSASAAAVLSMIGDEIHSSDMSLYLFHRMYTVGGNPFAPRKELVPTNNPIYILIDKIVQSKIRPYLTYEEWEYYMAGGDVILTGDELQRRLDGKPFETTIEIIEESEDE